MKTKQQLFVLAAIAGVFLWFFGAVLFQGRSFGFRDAANFYYPLFQWETQEWAAGRIPLWNPLDDTGTPVFAETTSSVLYPGKVVFALPISYRLRYHVYVTMHVLLAAAMAYVLARRWRASVEAAGLAGLAYGFGGSVVFQYCNVVFLVGASWLPAALLATDWMLQRRSLVGAVMLGMVLALMTLGGDPQAAYHTGLLAALYAWFGRRSADYGVPEERVPEERVPGGDLSEPPDSIHSQVSLRSTSATPLPTSGTPASILDPTPDAEFADDSAAALRKWYHHPLALLGCAACSGFLLAAVQIWPAMEAAARSDRKAFDRPRNVYEAAFAAARQDANAVDAAGEIFGEPSHATHLRHVYHFSVGPWHVAELLWPNCFGKPFPHNERWVNNLPAEGRTWTPSAYLGLLPILLAAMMVSAWRANWQTRFLIVVALLSLFGSFGWYGLGWLIQELRAAFSGRGIPEPWLGSPVGGLYWLLVTLLPGYVMFRYPAKLLVLTSLAISLLAARGWDRFVRDEPAKLSRAAMIVVGLSLALAAGFGLVQPAWRSWLADAPPNAIFGPIDGKAATSSVLTALAHTAACALLLVVVLRRVPISARSQLLLGMTAIELCLANAWMTVSIGADVWRADVVSVASAEGTAPPTRFYRDPNTTMLPKEWLRQSADDRLDEVVLWERAALLPRHHLRGKVAVIGAHTTLRSLDTASLLRVRQQYARQTRSKHPDALLAPLSVSRLVVAADREPAGCEKIDASAVSGIEFWSEPRAYPRVWLAPKAVILEPLQANSPRLAAERTREVFLDNGQPRDLRSVVFIEATADQRLRTDWPAPSSADDCRLEAYGPQKIVVKARTRNGAWLVLNDTFFPGWQATRHTNGQRSPAEIYRANRLMRAVLLPPGEHRVEFSYRPKRFWIGATVSGLAWLGACLLFTRLRAAPGSRPREVQIGSPLF